MSEEDIEFFGEGEDDRSISDSEVSSTFVEIESRILTREEAGECLHMLGKCDSGNKYAYLGMDVSDRLLTDISVIPTFRYVIFVNVSGNRLTVDALRIFAKMTYILMLEVDRNALTSIDFEPMPHLQILTLNKNKLNSTSNIPLKSLERLEMNYNRINNVAFNPYVLENLAVLELRGNRLTSTNGILFPALVRLYLAENRIDRITGLETLVNLKILHLRKNRISNLNGFDSRCAKLNYVNLRENRVAELVEFQKLSVLPCLETLIIIDNPAVASKEDAADEEKEYRIILLAILPNLKRIDKDPVLYEEKKTAKELKEAAIKDNTSFTNMVEDES